MGTPASVVADREAADQDPDEASPDEGESESREETEKSLDEIIDSFAAGT